MRPLEGMRVVALDTPSLHHYAGRHLADLGADVIKVERLGAGDFARDYDKLRQRHLQPFHLAQPRQARSRWM